MTTATDEHIAEALSVACEATREGDLQVLDAVADNLKMCDDGVLQALRAALNYMLVLDGHWEGWGAFHPSMEFGDKVYPAPLSRIERSWFPIWARVFSCAPYAYLQARFADLLWEAKYGDNERYKWGQRAIDAYLRALDEPFGEDVYLAKGACRALALTRQLRDEKRQSSAVKALRDLVRNDLDKPEYVPGVTLRSLAALASLPPSARPDDLLDLIEAAFECEQPFYTRINCVDLKLMLAGTQEEQRALWEVQVNLHAKEARVADSELARFKHFQDAIQLAEKRGLKDLSNELQREVGPLSEDALERVEATFEIPAANVEALIQLIVGDDNLRNALIRFGNEVPSGDPAQNRALAQGEFLWRSLATSLITGDKGELIKQFQTREEFEAYQVVSIEAENIGLFAAIAVHILKAIEDKYGAMGADASVFGSDLVDETQAEWIALAVRHYETEDYRSSVAVLAPRLENAIRGLAQRKGIVILRDSKGGKRVGGVKDLTGVLSELMGRMLEAKRRYWRTLLIESLGFNLRDRVAHGLIDDPTPQEAAILIHAACQLLTLHIQEPS